MHDPVQVPEPWLSKYRGKYNDGYDAFKVRRWKAAKKMGVVPESAKLADRHPMIRPWDELSKDERAVEARGMEVYAGMLAGVDYPAEFRGRKIESMRGHSMVGLLDGTSEDTYSATDFVGGEMGGGKWMRQGDHKAVMPPMGQASGNSSM